MKNKIMIFLLLTSLVPLISANGLGGLSNQTIFLNKTYGVPQDFIVQIRNADTFNFYNITIDTPSFSMVTIPLLQPNQSANVTVTTSINSNYVGTIRVKGYYSATIGASNETTPISVNYIDGVLPCSFSIVKGDTLVWNNTDTESLDMWNSDTSNKITTIPSHQTYSQTFNNPLVLNYHFTWLGFDFGQCSINVLSDTGYITNQDYDYLPNVNINVNYPPTTLNSTFLQTSYTMSVTQTQDGLMLVTNSGNETAKNITLSGNWFSFTPNNFDLSPGNQKTLSYTIKPFILTTNETNKTYIKNVQISGNFPTLNQNFSIFINYADMSASGIGTASLYDLLKQFCIDNPVLCGGNTQIIYNNGSENGNLSQEQFRQIISFLSTKFELLDAEVAYLKDQNTIVANQSQEQTDIINKTSTDVAQLKSDNQYRITFVQVIIIGVCLFVIVVGGSLIIRHYKKKKKEERLRRF